MGLGWSSPDRLGAAQERVTVCGLGESRVDPAIGDVVLSLVPSGCCKRNFSLGIWVDDPLVVM